MRNRVHVIINIEFKRNRHMCEYKSMNTYLLVVKGCDKQGVISEKKR